MNKIKDMPKSERPYEKCFENGSETLSDCELLSVILRTGVKEAVHMIWQKKLLRSREMVLIS